MEIAQNNVKDLEEDLREAKRVKDEMEDRLKALIDSPFFKDYKDASETKLKIKQLEDENRKLKIELSTARDANIRADTELKSKRKELEELTIKKQ